MVVPITDAEEYFAGKGKSVRPKKDSHCIDIYTPSTISFPLQRSEVGVTYLVGVDGVFQWVHRFLVSDFNWISTSAVKLGKPTKRAMIAAGKITDEQTVVKEFRNLVERNDPPKVSSRAAPSYRMSI